MPQLEERVTTIEERNRRVEYDKAWEVSWTRRGAVALVIYGCGVVLLNILGHDGIWKHALVPVMGYFLSTLSLPALKKIWVVRQIKQKV
ncbi:MAG: hypothetical protein AB7H77_11075 [Bdellovibrionales bacterium]